MPNLENLRKQAKQVLRWHRERYWPVAAQIRDALPTHRDLSDREILDRPFRLAEAQDVVARRAGYESWRTLRSKDPAVTTPTQTQAVTNPSLLFAEPQLFVSDIQRSCDFYTGKLGFQVAFTYGDPPFYGQVVRGGARLNLRHIDEPVIDDQLRRREDLLSALIAVHHVKLLFLEYQAAGVEFHQTLRTEPWGAKGFIVRDPDGNLVSFGWGGD
ncbi:MAG: bleomycin resistance protein [Caulobacterales bacterium]|jgi:catechol 2,3-dioxygenase-like lactoylglutathione lyase family enzyme